MGFFRLNSLTLTTVITLTVSAFVYPSSYCSSLINKRRSCSVGPLVSLVSSFHQCFPPCFPYGGFPLFFEQESTFVDPSTTLQNFFFRELPQHSCKEIKRSALINVN